MPQNVLKPAGYGSKSDMLAERTSSGWYLKKQKVSASMHTERESETSSSGFESCTCSSAWTRISLAFSALPETCQQNQKEWETSATTYWYQNKDQSPIIISLKCPRGSTNGWIQ